MRPGRDRGMAEQVRLPERSIIGRIRKARVIFRQKIHGPDLRGRACIIVMMQASYEKEIYLKNVIRFVCMNKEYHPGV